MPTVKDILVSNVQTVSPDDSVSKALGLFERFRIHQMPILSNGTVLGMIFLKDIVTKEIDPEKTKVSKFLRHVPSLKPEMTHEEAVRILLNAGIRAAPVIEKGKLIGILAETDLLQFVKSELKVNDVMSSPICASIEDKIGKVRSIMKRHNISRVPIVDKNKNLVGCVDTLDLIKVIKPKESLAKAIEDGREKLAVRELPVSLIMRDALPVGKNAKVNDLIELLKEHEEVVVVEEKIRKGKRINKPIGIITPKDILELLFFEEKKKPVIQLINIFEFDEIARDDINREVEKFLSKVEKLFNIESIFLYFDRHKRGGRVKHSIRVRLKTNVGLFVAHTWDWEVVKCLQGVLAKLEREVKKKHEKLVERTRKIVKGKEF